MTTMLDELADWSATLALDSVPDHTQETAINQVMSTLACIRSTRELPIGQRIVTAFGSPTQAGSARSAYVMAALATALDMDDIAYIGHLSASTVVVALAEAAAGRLDGQAFLEAIIAANECAARLTAATTLSPFFRNQTNIHSHLMGAAIVRLRTTNPPREQWINALGLALGILPTPLHHAVLASDSKPFIAASSIQLALDACDAAGAGIVGAHRVVEAKDGLLDHLAAVPLNEWVTDGLGTKWHTDTVSFKRFPGSIYLQAALDCAQALHHSHRLTESAAIETVEVHTSVLGWLLEQKALLAISQSADGDRSLVAATMSAGYSVATLLLTGQLTATDFDPRSLTDPERNEVASRVVTHHDMAFTHDMVGATVPLGETLRRAGARALEWPEFTQWAGADAAGVLDALGPPAADFTDATLTIGARITMRLRSGESLTHSVPASAGSCGSLAADETADLVQAKLVGTAVSAETCARLRNLRRLTAHQLRDLIHESLHAAPPLTVPLRSDR